MADRREGWAGGKSASPLLSAAGLAFVVAAGCASRSDPTPRLSKEPPEARPERIAAQNAAFASDLLRVLDAREPGNVFLSPHSLSTAMAMAWAGARGQTEHVIAKVMHWQDGPTATHDAFAALANRLSAPRSQSGVAEYEWTSANRLWLGMPVSEMFARVLEVSYASDTSPLDLGDKEASAAAINRWAATWTQGRITRILSPDDLDGVRFVLTNAVYFKGLWATPFEEASTRPGPFHLVGEEVIQVPMMHAERRVRHADGEGWQAVSLPYHGGVSCVLFQVNQGEMPAFLSGFDGGFIQTCMSRMRPRQADLAIPKFAISSRFSARQALESLGMALAFSDAADFSGITTVEPLAISDVIHAATIEFDEAGTVAAAVTAIGVAPTSMPLPEDQVVFHLDRPFVLAIVHDASQSVLFLGRINDPRR